MIWDLQLTKRLNDLLKVWGGRWLNRTHRHFCACLFVHLWACLNSCVKWTSVSFLVCVCGWWKTPVYSIYGAMKVCSTCEQACPSVFLPSCWCVCLGFFRFISSLVWILLIPVGLVDCVNNVCKPVYAGAQSLGVCQAMVHTGHVQGESGIWYTLSKPLNINTHVRLRV